MGQCSYFFPVNWNLLESTCVLSDSFLSQVLSKLSEPVLSLMLMEAALPLLVPGKHVIETWLQ